MVKGNKMKKIKEKELITIMINLYNKKKFKQKQLTKEMQELLDYSYLRIENCPHRKKNLNGEKPFCSCCSIQCYKADMRQNMVEVMKFSGPRILFSHPIVAIDHLQKTLKFKKEQKREVRNDR